jgi:hypothetical protein
MKRLLPVLMGFVFLLLSSTEGWSLPPCPGSPTNSGSTAASWTDCFGIWTVSSGDHAGYKYVGEFKDGQPHGQGTGTFSAPHKNAGEKYVGEWKDGKPCAACLALASGDDIGNKINRRYFQATSLATQHRAGRSFKTVDPYSCRNWQYTALFSSRFLGAFCLVGDGRGRG